MLTVSHKLAQLILAHPGLPVIPLVQSEVVGEDAAAFEGWIGCISAVKIKHYVKNSIGDLMFDDPDDAADVVKKMLGWKAFSELREEEIQEEYSKLPWKEAIFVLIERP